MVVVRRYGFTTSCAVLLSPPAVAVMVKVVRTTTFVYAMPMLLRLVLPGRDRDRWWNEHQVGMTARELHGQAALRRGCIHDQLRVHTASAPVRGAVRERQ
ncbi:MAG: hypothetical protein ACRENP_15230 [Longimicrobiales bacterium]